MTLGPDLLLDDDTHDLLIVDGDLVAGVDVAQAVKIRVLFVLGEWFLDTSKGVPYFEKVFVKAPNLDHLRTIFRETIEQTPGVGTLETFELDLDRATRRLSIAWKSDQAEGEIVRDVGVPTP